MSQVECNDSNELNRCSCTVMKSAFFVPTEIIAMVNLLGGKCNEATIHATQRLCCLEENHECRVQRRFSCDRRLRSIFLSRECFSSRGEVLFLLWLSALKITPLSREQGFPHMMMSLFFCL